MAVDAHHLNHFLGNREVVNPMDGIYNPQMGLSGTATAAVNGFPSLQLMKSDSGLTYNHLPTVSRKRSRDSVNPFISYESSPPNQKVSSPFSFLGEDISFHIQQQQFDVDRLISQHMEKVRLEIEEKRKRQTRKIMEALEEGMMKRLRSKEEEIEKIGKLNWALEERVKSLCIENQIWRDLAQTNEATANVLRTNLEHVLAQVKDERISGRAGLDEAGGLDSDDAQSCCGSNGNEEEERRRLAGNSKSEGRWCRNCGKEESCVLVLPCRHLCLCTVCGSTLHICPICKSTNNASLHVNFS